MFEDEKRPSPATSPGNITAILAVAGILVSLAQTLIIPLIIDLPQMFDTSAANASWIITVTLLAGAISTPIAGRLADLYGKKPLLLLCISAFVSGSVICALAPNLALMIVGRALQGLASGLVPLGIALLHGVLPPAQAGKAIAFMSSSMGIGGAIGLPLAASVAQFANWRTLFWAVGVLGLIVGYAIYLWIPRDTRVAPRAPFDVLGAVGLAAGLIPVLLAITKGLEWGWWHPVTLTTLGSGVLILIVWGWFQSRRKHPLVNLRSAIIPTVFITNIASVLFGFSMYAMNLLLPPVIQLPTSSGYGLGQSMVAMGLWLMPMGFGMMAVSSLGASISYRRGPAITLALAGVVTGSGYALVALTLATLGPTLPLLTLLLYALACVVTGCGIGFAFGAMPSLIMGQVPASETAQANGLNSLMRSLGTTSASAVLGVLLAASQHEVAGTLVPTKGAYLTGLGVTVAVAFVAAVLALLAHQRVKRA